MRPRMVPIGFGNLVHAERVIAMVVPDSAPVRRLVSDARDRGMLIDATQGRRTRAVIIADSGHVILSAVNPETVAARMEVDEDGYGRGPANRGCV